VSVATRLARLEQSVGTEPPDRCASCGADWVGSTVLAQEPDGRRHWVCVRCLGERERPTRYVRGWSYPIDLLRALL